jgi:predicted Zn-dependent peptidase
MPIDAAFKFLDNFPTLLSEEINFEGFKKDLIKENHPRKFPMVMTFAELLDTHIYSRFDIYREIENLNFEGVQDFADCWMEQLRIQISFAGNIRKKDCLKVTEKLLKNFRFVKTDNVSLKKTHFRKISMNYFSIE